MKLQSARRACLIAGLLPAMLVLTITPSIFSSGTKAAPPPAATPEQIVRDFYAWYTHVLSSPGGEPLKDKTTALKYLTPTLLANVHRIERQQDVDIFICAQDWSEEWTKTLAMEPPKITGPTATTVVTFTVDNNDKLKIKLTLKHLATGWRIDRAGCVR